MKTIIAESHYRDRHVIVSRVSHENGPSSFEAKEVVFHNFHSKKAALDWCKDNHVRKLQMFDDGSAET